MKQKFKRKLKTLGLCGILILGLSMGVSKVVTVSNTVNGKELPIYSVETEEKKVALSFDAAWGNGRRGIFMDCEISSVAGTDYSKVQRMFARFAKKI